MTRRPWRDSPVTRRTVLGAAATAVAGYATRAQARPGLLKVAVVGGGASGITAAHELSRRGHAVTVFEAEDRVGGKVASYEHHDHVFELGAIAANGDYTTVLELARRAGVTFTRCLQTLSFLDGGRTYDPRGFWQARYGKGETAAALARLELLTRRYRGLHHTNVDAPPELHQSFASYVALHHLEPLSGMFQGAIVGCGYGYYEEVPALYLVKLLRMMVQTALRVGPFDAKASGLLVVPHGFATLWQALASGLDVRLGRPVTRVLRHATAGGTRVEVTAGGETESFDRLVIACPLDGALLFLDATDEEAALFGKIRHYRYHVTVFRGESLPRGDALFLMANTVPSTIGHLVAVHNKYPEANLWTAYQLAPWHVRDDEVQGWLAADVATLGGTVTHTLVEKRWTYFPHVSSEELARGFYGRLHALQGLRGTYLTGAVLNFETVEHAAAHAQRLVRAYF